MMRVRYLTIHILYMPKFELRTHLVHIVLLDQYQTVILNFKYHTYMYIIGRFFMCVCVCM